MRMAVRPLVDGKDDTALRLPSVRQARYGRQLGCLYWLLGHCPVGQIGFRSGVDARIATTEPLGDGVR
jgi:hypothetical protein